MKKAILAVLFASLNCGAWAQWVKVSETKQSIEQSELVSSFFVDPATIRSNGNLRRATTMLSVVVIGRSQGFSTKTLSEFDCWESRIRVLAMTAYEKPMGEGKVFEPSAEKAAEAKRMIGVWDDVPPGRADEAMLKHVCAR